MLAAYHGQQIHQKPVNVVRTRAAGLTQTLLVAIIAAIPALIAASITGVFETPDIGAYLTYAAMIPAGPLPRGEAFLGSSHAPIPLYRTPGYPAVIAVLQYVSLTHSMPLLFLVQLLSQALLAAYTYRVGLAHGRRPVYSFVAALMPAAGSVAVFQSAVMTDALFGALFGGAMLLRFMRAY